ncbi:MarR family winged helix-turn-helix transcriptional regulator [Paragemmobacter aquarius]|nr:MarR family transcriptional regulator [Gemmobacter aquarius]
MLCFALYSAAHAMQAAYKPLLDPLGLTYPQYLALAALWSQDGQTVGQVSATLRLDSNTLTPLLKRLEQSGYLTRSRDPADERQVRLNLTERGHAIREQAASVPQCFLDLTGLGQTEAATLRDDLTALRNRMRPR